jgi:GNAT superfamily N-acetyltransferase
MLRQLAIDDMDRAAVVLRMSFDEAFPDLAGLHTPDEDLWFFREHVFATCQLWGYFDGKELLGFIAFREGWIDQFYVLPSSQGRGIGTALLQVAQSKSGYLSLWTFLRNTNARRFYEKHHFIFVKETDGTRNEEKEPDAMYSWLRGTPTLVSIPTPRGATQAFILTRPDHPVASVVLFDGGRGVLVGSRDKFAAHNYMVAVVDAPSDQQHGMNAIFRMSDAHAGDIGAIASYLKNEAAVPVWLIGTGMGSFSAAIGAIAGSKDIDGLVLTSTVTRAPPEWAIAKSHPNGVADMALSEIAVPTLIMSRREDGCNATPAADAAMLRTRLTRTRKAEFALLGGDPQSSPCPANPAHGYFGMEAEAIDTIARFINSNGQ